MKLDDALIIAGQVHKHVNVYCDKIEIVGSMRRSKNVVNDIDFVCLVASDKNWKALKLTMEHVMYAKIESAGKAIMKCDIPQIIDGKKTFVRVEFYRGNESNYGILKLIRTGSAKQNEYLANLALKNGMQLKYSVGLMQNQEILAGADEYEVFRALGLDFVLPQAREILNGKPIWMK